MKPETVVRILQRAGIRFATGRPPELLRRGDSRSYIWLVKTREWGEAVLKYQDNALRIDQEVGQYKNVKGYFGPLMVRYFCWGPQYILMEYVGPGAENLNDLLQEPKNGRNLVRVVETLLDQIMEVWEENRIRSTTGQPSGFKTVVADEQQSTAHLGLAGTQLKRILRGWAQLPVRLHGEVLNFSVEQLSRRIHGPLMRPISAWCPLHGDLNPGNILVMPNGDFRLVDPHIEGRELRLRGGVRGGGDWVRDVAAALRFENQHTIQKHEADPLHGEDGKLVVHYHTTFDPRCSELVDVCLEHATRYGEKCNDRTWKERLWLHVASMFIVELADLDRRRHAGLIPAHQNLDTFLLGKAIEAYRKAAEAAKEATE